LNKVQDIKRLLSRIINQVLSGELDNGKANCIGQLCNIMLRAMEKSELELRLDELELLIGSKSKSSTGDNL